MNTNFLLVFRNSIWQYGELNILNILTLSDLVQIGISVFKESEIANFLLVFWNSISLIQYSGLNILTFSDLDQNWYLWVLGIGIAICFVNCPSYNTANPMWQTKYINVFWFASKSNFSGLRYKRSRVFYWFSIIQYELDYGGFWRRRSISFWFSTAKPLWRLTTTIFL